MNAKNSRFFEMRTVLNHAVPLFLLLPFSTACNTVAESLVQKPKVTLEKVGVRDANAKGATILFNVGVDNPNPFGVTVDSIRYDVELGGKKFSSGKMDKAVHVTAKQKSVVEIPIEVKYTDIFDSLIEVLQKKSSSYRIKGDAAFGILTIPFDESGDLKLR